LNIFICSITMSVMITLRDISGPMHSHEIPHLILFFPFFCHCLKQSFFLTSILKSNL
jgi:hypothetical protein